MVSHGLSSAGGCACLTVMQTTVGDPRFVLAVQGCIVSLCMPYEELDFGSFSIFQLERIM